MLVSLRQECVKHRQPQLFLTWWQLIISIARNNIWHRMVQGHMPGMLWIWGRVGWIEVNVLWQNEGEKQHSICPSAEGSLSTCVATKFTHNRKLQRTLKLLEINPCWRSACFTLVYILSQIHSLHFFNVD